jgi:hypothetical protein
MDASAAAGWIADATLQNLHRAKAATKVRRETPKVVRSASDLPQVDKGKEGTLKERTVKRKAETVVETVKEDEDETVVETVKEDEDGAESRGPKRQVKDPGGDRNLTATKADDSAIPVWLWNDAVHAGLTSDPAGQGHTKERIDRALDTIRTLLLCKQTKLEATRSYFRYLHLEHPDLPRTDGPVVEYYDEGTSWGYRWQQRFDRNVGAKSYRGWCQSFWGIASADRCPGWDALWRLSDSTWWEWSAGSAPLYWRWPAEYRLVIRDGLEIWFQGDPPNYQRPQRGEKDPATRNRVIEKLDTVQKRKYIAPGLVTSLTDFFSVPKGKEDIRLVYNGTKSGLNQVLWVPGFPMPTTATIIRAIFAHSWMDDSDLGEFFLNFILHQVLRELAGVDLTLYRTAKELAKLTNRITAVCWERWARCAMGLKPSPYQTGQAMLFAEDVIRGCRFQEKNIFRWKRVVRNLPGLADYDPSLPWIYKERATGDPAAEFALYCDDNRAAGNDRLEAKLAARRVASVCNHLGVQDAARKRREASQTPGAWAGSVISTDGKGVFVTVSQEKWDKARTMIEATREELASNGGCTNHKELERRRGFLLYVTRTYPAMVPYLKGIHLTLDGWRDGRDADGWKLNTAGRRAQEAMSRAD